MGLDAAPNLRKTIMLRRFRLLSAVKLNNGHILFTVQGCSFSTHRLYREVMGGQVRSALYTLSILHSSNVRAVERTSIELGVKLPPKKGTCENEEEGSERRLRRRPGAQNGRTGRKRDHFVNFKTWRPVPSCFRGLGREGLYLALTVEVQTG